jgi:glycosyltransferase involved in cell wall biosynthesis
MRKKVINILFNDFTNDNRVLKESVSLIKGGFDVELVATRFDKTLPKSEMKEGIKIVRLKVGSFTFLPLNLFLFWTRIVKNYRKEMIFHGNDLYALPPAYIIKKIFNKDAKIIYDCHEHETEAGIYIGKPLLKFFAKMFERLMIYSADAVITVSESIAEDYVDIYGISKPKLVLNCPPYKKYSKKDLFRKELDIGENKVIFLYQGEYLKGRGVDNLIDIFKKLEDKNKDLVLILLVYGDGINSLKDSIKGSTNIYWHDKVPQNIYMDYVVSCDWGIYLMENICKNHDFALPNKIFDYVMAGLPLIVSNLKEMTKFVNKYEIGYLIDPNNEDQIIELLEKIKKGDSEKFEQKLEYVSKEYIWEEQEKTLLNIYKSL